MRDQGISFFLLFCWCDIDIDYVLFTDSRDKLEAIEMQNSVPQNNDCGESHAVALVWQYAGYFMASLFS